MKHLRGAPLLAFTLIAGCTDSPAGPPPFASVSIEADAVPFEERTIRVGQSIQLDAALFTAGGKPAEGPAITWRSTLPEVASVDTSGLVTGRAEGMALVIASAGPIADTARVNVASPPSGAIACAPGDPGLRLAVGEIHTTTADRAVTLCVDGADGAEYALIPFNGSRVTDARASLSVHVAAKGTVPTTTALTDLAAHRALAVDRQRPTTLESDLHRQLRARAMPSLERRMRALHAAPAPISRSLAAAVPRAGDLIRLNAETSSVDGCAAPVPRTGRVVAVTTRAIVVADTANPDGFSDAEYQDFGMAFDELVYPLDIENFGTPSDLDSNQRVVIFFTHAVNEMTSAGSGFYVAGFFYDRDLFPKSGAGACEGSNQAELFYMMVPDPERANDGELVFTKTHVREHTLSVLAHEFQHLINASRRLHVNDAPVWEEEWLNEGLSHIAEELLFYRETGLTPRSNHSGATINSPAARLAFRDHQIQNIDRLIRYLADPQGGSPIGNDDELATRGASWAFLRYAADRRGGDEREMWRSLVDAKTSGLTNLSSVLRTDAVPWLHDWSVSLYVDDTRISPAAQYQQPSWNFRQLIPSLTALGGSQSYSRYPLRLLGLAGEDPTMIQLRAGSTAYLRFGVPAGQQAAIRTTSGGLPAPSTLRLALVRTK